jgi:hypothetical protein
MIHNRIAQITLTTGLAISLILGLSSNTPTTAQEIYIDNNCKQNQQLNEVNKAQTLSPPAPCPLPPALSQR